MLDVILTYSEGFDKSNIIHVHPDDYVRFKNIMLESGLVDELAVRASGIGVWSTITAQEYFDEVGLNV